VPYLLAVLFPPPALLWCRKPGQALLSVAALLAVPVGSGAGVPGDPLPSLLASWLVLRAVARQRAPGGAGRGAGAGGWRASATRNGARRHVRS
jgi:hypothetical protein